MREFEECANSNVELAEDVTDISNIFRNVCPCEGVVCVELAEDASDISNVFRNVCPCEVVGLCGVGRRCQ